MVETRFGCGFSVLAMLVLFARGVSGFTHRSRRRAFLRCSTLNASSDDVSKNVNDLLGSVLRRAQTTLSDKDTILKQQTEDPSFNDLKDSISQAVDVEFVSSSVSSGVTSLLESTIERAQRTMESNESLSTSSSSSSTTTIPKQKGKYKSNPAITNTALAQTLWSTILRPNIDSAIDATCGNGYDSVVLAQLLFDNALPSSDCQSKLLCLDIQQHACQSTTMALVEAMGSELVNDPKRYIQVKNQSHAPLPRPMDKDGNESSSVALVVYNLGYLPNSDKECVTKLKTTLQSIVDAMLMIRLGGMVSVVTYPKTNLQEDQGVRAFLECAALLTSNLTTWQDFLNDAKDLDDETRSLVQLSMARIVAEGYAKQTWRVSEHKKLGMDRAPKLVTATRIK